MKKLFLIASFIVLGTTATQAQDYWNFGIKGGANFATIANEDGENPDGRTSFNVGAMVEIPVSDKFSIQPEVLYGNINDGSVLYIPVLFKYYISESGFNLMAGPQATIDLEEAEEGYNSLGVDASFGIGYDINENFFIDARYSLEVTNRIGDLPGLPDNISGKINSLQIGVGYKF